VRGPREVMAGPRGRTPAKGAASDRWEDLVSLPGVGAYLAGAVLSFGYGERAPVLDSNIVRLLSRLTGAKGKGHEDYLGLLWELVPEEGHDLFNYGLIDLGALVCHYRGPMCGACPLRDLCAHYLEGAGDKGAAECLRELYLDSS